MFSGSANKITAFALVNGFLVSKETVVLRWWESETKIWFCSDEGLTLETSAFQIFHGGNSTFINSFDKTKFLD